MNIKQRHPELRATDQLGLDVFCRLPVRGVFKDPHFQTGEVFLEVVGWRSSAQELRQPMTPRRSSEGLLFGVGPYTGD